MKPPNDYRVIEGKVEYTCLVVAHRSDREAIAGGRASLMRQPSKELGPVYMPQKYAPFEAFDCYLQHAFRKIWILKTPCRSGTKPPRHGMIARLRQPAARALFQSWLVGEVKTSCSLAYDNSPMVA